MIPDCFSCYYSDSCDHSDPEFPECFSPVSIYLVNYNGVWLDEEDLKELL